MENSGAGQVGFSIQNETVANKGGWPIKSSGSGQDSFSNQDQTVAPSCTGTAARAVIEGRDAKAKNMFDCYYFSYNSPLV